LARELAKITGETIAEALANAPSPQPMSATRAPSSSSRSSITSRCLRRGMDSMVPSMPGARAISSRRELL
jgi:hypothetical protein